jgi:hypothetical protein
MGKIALMHTREEYDSFQKPYLTMEELPTTRPTIEEPSNPISVGGMDNAWSESCK